MRSQYRTTVYHVCRLVMLTHHQAYVRRSYQYTSCAFVLENILANASYEVIKGYPVPPRSLRIQLALFN